MIDDIVEGTAKGIIKGTLRFIFQIIVEFILFYTGEIVLFVLTFGRRKPRWNYYADEPASKFVIFTELSTWVGFVVWLFMAWFINSTIHSH